jgi:hypothetical protein
MANINLPSFGGGGGAPTGPAGGALSGTYPNPTLANGLTLNYPNGSPAIDISVDDQAAIRWYGGRFDLNANGTFNFESYVGYNGPNIVVRDFGDGNVYSTSKYNLIMGYTGGSGYVGSSEETSIVVGNVYNGGLVYANAPQSFVLGRVGDIGGVGSSVQTNSTASFAMGHVYLDNSVIQTNGDGSMAFGYNYGVNNYIYTGGAGSLVFGIMNGGNNNYIRTNNDGAFAFGEHNGVNGILQAGAPGAFAFGQLTGDGGVITADGSGSLAGGLVEGTTCNISTSGAGAIAFGYASGQTSSIQANDNGSMAIGLTISTNSTIVAASAGSIAHGYVANSDSIISTTDAGAISGGWINGKESTISGGGSGGIAHGAITGNSSQIIAGLGCFAMGFIKDGGGRILANTDGTFAFGHVDGTSEISATSVGAAAQGFTTGLSKISTFSSSEGARAEGWSSENSTIAVGDRDYRTRGSLARGFAIAAATIQVKGNPSYNINPDADGATAFGFAQSNSVIQAIANGAVASGVTTADRATISAEDFAARAHGYAAGGNGRILALSPASEASGVLDADGIIQGSGQASYARGYITSSGVITAGDASLSMGSVNKGVITATNSSFAWGIAADGTIQSGIGGLAFGHVADTGIILNQNDANAAFGLVKAGATILSQNLGGSLVFGYANGAIIRTTDGNGALVFGHAERNAIIQGQNQGVFAGGYSQSSSFINANGIGSMAFGISQETSEITAAGAGSGAFGYAVGATSNIVNGRGSFSFSESTYGNTFVAGTGSFSSGSGNTLSGSFNTAIGIRNSISADQAQVYGFGLSQGGGNAISIGNNFSNSLSNAVVLGAGTSSLWIDGNTSGSINAITKLNVSASTTTRASMNIAPGPAPSSPVDGDIWYDSGQKSLIEYTDNIKQDLVGAIFSQTSSTTVTNTTVETNISGTGVGTLTLPANFLVIGKTMSLKAKGFHSGIAGASNTLTIRVYYGATVILTGTVPASAATNVGVDLDAMITCRTNGASGTVMSQGYYSELSPTPSFHPLYATGGAASTTTINTTTSNAIRVTAQWGNASASNSITITNLTVTIIN